MASQWPNDADSVLRGLWGSLVSGAESGGRGAANMWDTLRSAATDWASGVLAVTSSEPPTQQEIQAKVEQYIGHVTIQDMNRTVVKVGEFLRAKQSLQSLGESQQITGASIFEPAWATTADNPAVPTRYRITVGRNVHYRGIGTQSTKWATYELSGPLTTVADALAQANSLFSQARYNRSAVIDEILDYSIEVV